MEKPFVFGKAVSDSNFIGREEESERLRQNFSYGVNTVDKHLLKRSLQDLIDENSPLYMHQTESLTTFQLNFLRAILNGIHTNFGCAEIREQFHLGSYSNINRIIKSLIDKELISDSDRGIFISDPILCKWLEQNI